MENEKILKVLVDAASSQIVQGPGKPAQYLARSMYGLTGGDIRHLIVFRNLGKDDTTTWGATYLSDDRLVSIVAMQPIPDWSRANPGEDSQVELDAWTRPLKQVSSIRLLRADARIEAFNRENYYDLAGSWRIEIGAATVDVVQPPANGAAGDPAGDLVRELLAHFGDVQAT